MKDKYIPYHADSHVEFYRRFQRRLRQRLSDSELRCLQTKQEKQRRELNNIEARS